MMADFNPEQDGNDKNFILAKLVSIFGDSVEFDVISIVAQENDWNEAKCIESLTVLGEYKNIPAIGVSEEIECVQLYSQITGACVNDDQLTDSSTPSSDTMSQRKKSVPSDATPRAPRSNHLVSGAISRNVCPPSGRQSSPAPSSSPKAKERSSETQEHHDQVKNLISSHTPVLILLRGLPGSGKSTLSKQLLSMPGGRSGCTCSADDFFLVPNGGKGQKEYRYDPLRLEDAHKHCRIQVLRAMAHGVTPIIVDNTNTQAWEMLPYAEMALEPWKAEESLRKMVAEGSIAKRNVCSCLGPFRNSFKGKKCNCGFTVMDPPVVPYQVELLEPLTWWYRNPTRLAKVNQHGVTQKKITQMLSHFEYGLTGKDLIKQVLKKKPQKKHTVPAQQQNHPSVPKVKPSKENKPSAPLAGAPLVNRAKHVKMKANHLSNQFAHGSNQFQQPVTNPLPNFVGFPSGPYVQPILYSPSMFNTGSTGLPNLSKNTKVEFMGPQEQFRRAAEDTRCKQSSSNLTIFPGVQPTNLFSSRESEVIDSDGSSSENISSKSDVIGRNPFLQSVDSTASQEVNASANVQRECIEISEEEQREWMHATASKFMNWQSSEEEESGDELLKESSEPKPARSIWHRHAAVLATKITGKNTGDSDSQDTEKNDRVDEWVTEGIDPLASWNVSSNASNADSQKASDESESQKNDGPLPPRSPKKKCLAENSSKDTDEAEQMERITNTIEGHEFGWIKDIRLLLKALGLDKDKSDTTQVSSNDSETTSKTAQISEETDQAGDNLASLSNVPDGIGLACNPVDVHVSTEPALNSFEADEEMDKCSAVIHKTEGEIIVESSSAKTNFETSNEGLPTLTPSVNMLDPLLKTIEVKPADAADDSSVIFERKDEQQTDHVADQVETTKMSVHVPEAPVIDVSISVNDDVSISVNDDLHGSQSELKNCASTPELNRPVGDIFEEVKNVSSDKGDRGIVRHDVAGENETLDLMPSDGESCHSSVGTNECNVMHGKTESGKMTVLKSLLMGIEKAQKRSAGEFENGEMFLEGTLTGNPKPDVHSELLKEAETPPLGGGSSASTVADSPEAAHELEPSNSTVDNCSRTTDAIGELEKQEASLIEECGTSAFTLDNSSLVKESLSKSIVMKDADDYIFPSLISLPFEYLPPLSSSSSATIKLGSSHEETKTDSLIEVNLHKEEKNCESFTVVTNEEVTIGCCSNPSSLLPEDDDNCPFFNIQSKETKNISDLSIKEISLPSGSAEQMERTEDICEISSTRLAPVTAQSVFEKTGKFLVDNLGESSQKLSVPDSIYPDLCLELEGTKISKSDSGIDDFVVAEELQPCIDKSTVEEKDGITCDDDAVMYPLVLDSNFVDLLYGTFGNPFEEPLNESARLPSGSANGTTINIPSSLARKLHECLLKSQWDSILAEEDMSQKMLIEDELLARQLQELENEDLKDTREFKNPSSHTPNLREIMDMEKAMAMYNADQSKTILNNQRNDISTRLTWDLLVKEFPQVPQNVIAQIFSAYDFSYANAREALLTSLPEYERDSHAGGVKDVVSPEAIAAQEKALLEKVKLESLKFQRRGETVEEESEEDDEDEVSWKEMVEEARKSAALNRRLQKERHAQAQAANRSGMASAAAYYCQMATLHKQRAEEDSRKAAHILSKVFTGRYGSSRGGIGGRSPMVSLPPTLDMHSMKVSEAVTVMNAFLDSHIECLRADQTRQPIDASRRSIPAKTKTIFLVTGRGLNSLGGIPRIKPAVEKQLEMRGVRYEEMNPGLLRVLISADQPTKRKVG